MSPRPAAVAPTGVEVATRQGPARVRVRMPTPSTVPVTPSAPGQGSGALPGTLLLGHGAGGQRDAADVLALTALADQGWTVVLVDQPWRVAGRKVASPPPALDQAFADLTAAIGTEDWQREHAIPLPRPWVLGGRSAGARVACRAAVDAAGAPVPGVAAVVCLAFPLHPPGRPERSRAAELAGPVGAGLPTLVVQGARDPFGSPEEVAAAVAGPALTLRTVPGTHSPSRGLPAVLDHVRGFLADLLSPGHDGHGTAAGTAR